MSKPLKYKFGNDLATEADIIQSAYAKANQFKGKQKREYLNSIKSLFQQHKMKNKFQTIYIPSAGALFLIGIITLTYITPFPSKFQTGVLWAALSLAAGACAAVIPGFFEFRLQNVVRATGGIAVFAFMYSNSPNIIKSTMDGTIKQIVIHLVHEDNSGIDSIYADFNPNDNTEISETLTKIINSYYGTSFNSNYFIFYRNSDGKIYTKELCREIDEYSVIIIPLKIVQQFNNKRLAYLKYKDI